MIIEQAIKNFLLVQSTITNLTTVNRINYSVLPQGPTYPWITFFRYSNPISNDINLAHTYLQFDIWALTYVGAIELAVILRNVLNREKAVLSGIGIKQISFDGEGYMYEVDTKIHHIDNRFKVVYFE